jgi:sugar (pentulose or hexulose) kinase
VLPTVTVDIGTTSVKLCLFDKSGTLSASARHPTPTVPDAWGEIYDVDALYRLIVTFIRSLDCQQRQHVRRISLTGVGESGGLVRPDLTLASPMILWHDHRGAEYLARLGIAEREVIYRVTGLPVNANYGLSKVVWATKYSLGEHDAQWLNIVEYLAARMTGQRWSEYSLASRTMALDITDGKWSQTVCDLVGLNPGVFPPLRNALEGSPLTGDMADDLALADDVQVHVAGHDHMVGAVGAGLRAGELLNSTGTTEGLLFVRERPSLDALSAQSMLANGVACTGSEYTLFASIPTGGSAFATLQTMLGIDRIQLTARVAALHESYVAGQIDLGRVPLLLPQFRGSPPPTKNAAARGAMSGLLVDTTADEIIFGCFLGMARQFHDVLELFQVSHQVTKVIGPAASNSLWLQLKADLMGKPLSASQLPEVVSRGAQALASEKSCEWETTQPYTVTVDDDQHSRLAQWSFKSRARWDHLKGTPQ